jgi:hypothetical protein
MNAQETVTFVDLERAVTTLQETEGERLTSNVKNLRAKLDGFAGENCSSVGKTTEDIEL